MNKGLLFLCLGVLAFAGWRERETLQRFLNSGPSRAPKTADDASGQPPALPVDDAAKPEVAATPPPAAENLAAPRLPELPPDLYLLRERVTISTDAGIRAYAAGTEVTKTGEEAGQYQVTDGKNSFAMAVSKLTRDPAEVKKLRQSKLDAALPAPNASGSPSKIPAASHASPESVQRRRELEGQISEINRQLYQFGKTLQRSRMLKAEAHTPEQILKAGNAITECEKAIQALQYRKSSIVSQLSTLPK